MLVPLAGGTNSPAHLKKQTHKRRPSSDIASCFDTCRNLSCCRMGDAESLQRAFEVRSLFQHAKPVQVACAGVCSHYRWRPGDAGAGGGHGRPSNRSQVSSAWCTMRRSSCTSGAPPPPLPPHACCCRSGSAAHQLQHARAAMLSACDRVTHRLLTAQQQAQAAGVRQAAPPAQPRPDDPQLQQLVSQARSFLQSGDTIR